MIIDTHAHYDDEAFDTDREALLTSMYDGGIEKIVNVCASVGGFQDTVKLMEKYPFVYGAVGIHPDDADKMTQETLDEIITVEDDELIVAFLDMVENHKMIVENSGLLTVAALRHLDFKNKKVVSILSGGNMDVITMSSVVQHGLIQRDRIFTVSVLIPDKPGELVRVASIIAENQGNVIKLDHNQFVSTNRNAAVELKITLEAFGTDHKNQIVKALETAGCRPKVIRASL